MPIHPDSLREEKANRGSGVESAVAVWWGVKLPKCELLHKKFPVRSLRVLTCKECKQETSPPGLADTFPSGILGSGTQMGKVLGSAGVFRDTDGSDRPNRRVALLKRQLGVVGLSRVWHIPPRW